MPELSRPNDRRRHQPDDSIAALKAMAIESADDAGNISYDAFVQANRGNHFTVIEAWVNKDAFDAHAAAAHTRD